VAGYLDNISSVSSTCFLASKIPLDTGGFDGRQARTRRQVDELKAKMESLKTLKSTGRGKGVRGRWRNYRNNSTTRGEIWFTTVWIANAGS